jgi:hypothetical protein
VKEGETMELTVMLIYRLQMKTNVNQKKLAKVWDDLK